MKYFSYLATLLLFCGTSTFAAPNANTTNKVQVATVETDHGVFFGEPQSLIDKRALDLRDTAACTKCVGSHGLCTIGEGNCYPPDGCYFCGDCGANQARCQNPSAEPCQCY